MKTMKTVFISFLVTSLIFSCKKSSTNNNNNTGNGTMTAKVDGTSFNANLAVVATITGTSPVVCAFAGTGSDGQINVTIGSYTGPGNYAINASSISNMANYTLTASPFTSYVASAILGSGTISITSDTGGYLEGTFSFSGKNNSGGTIISKEITEGSFKIKL